MEDLYSKSYEEVYEVINLMPSELSNKIPSKFVKMIEDKRSKTYSKNLKSIDDVENADLMEETVVILGLIYRDFLCSPEERKVLQEQEKEIERKEKEKYNPDNIFKNDKQEVVEAPGEDQFKEEVNALVEVKEKSLFKRLIEKIKGFFKK